MRSVWIIISMVLVLLFAAGCTNRADIPQPTTSSTTDGKETLESSTSSTLSGTATSTKETAVTTINQPSVLSPATTTTKDDTIVNVDEPIPAFSGNIVIHQISRDAFYRFLEEPSYGRIKQGSFGSYTYPEDGEWYVKWGASRFSVRDELITFAGSKDQLETYLLQNHITDEAQGAILYEAPHVPLTVWVKTTQGHVFITINEDVVINEDSYVYKFYDQSAYYEKFKQREAKLIVKGTRVTAKTPTKLYYNYADLPMIAVLEAMGATVKPKNDTVYSISFKGKDYVLNLSKLSLAEAGSENDNLLTRITGGPTFMYPVGNELMIDHISFRAVLRAMGDDSSVKVDMSSETVTIA